ncbi:MAG: DNA-directed RNA polymerase subunit beta' [Abitibacteriaceae bacterium]|nr:DNA-directed RNA polymerase subunit beta' [Abditibacteriaceae bacterium]
MAETNIFSVPALDSVGLQTGRDGSGRDGYGGRDGAGARQAAQTLSASAFDLLRIGIASPQDIRSWSRGEVKKPETINYRTFKPERDGLFCERIFGPTKDLECSCGKFKKSKFKGVICDRCGVEVTRAKVRRVRMGHIELAAPVAHLWYVKGVPSPMALLLDMSPRFLERVLYFSHWVVTRADQGKISKNIERIRDAVQDEMQEIDNSRELEKKRALDTYAEAQQRLTEGDETITREDVESARKRAEDVSGDAYAEDRKRELQDALGLLAELEKRRLLTDSEYRGLQKLMETITRKLGRGFEDMFHAGMGAEAVKKLLEDIDLEALGRELKKSVQETPTGAKRGRLIKRLEIVEAFRKSKNRPEWMVLETIPVMPPELRPMVQLDGGRFATSDLNDLYRRIINRNNRLKRITEIRAPESIINHEKRLLQESVDALIDNTRRQRPVTGSSGRPLKSLSDMLKGKEGRFRKNLLGKRVDYSGRSVIVVGPGLRLDQCGLPKEMALELFKPFVMKRLVQKGYTTNIKTARRMVDRLKPEVWDALEEVIREHPVLLNRAPTLHRLGIQAFEPKLVDGKAIQIHPLVCPSFNADFDGDQMAVHVPLFPSAQAEARVLMMSTNNLFSPRDGAPAMSPGYDMVLGCFYLTMDKKNARSVAQLTPEEVQALPRFSSADEAITMHHLGNLELHDVVSVRHPAGEKKTPEAATGMLTTTVGRLIFNEIVPEALGYVNHPVDKKTISHLVVRCHEELGNEDCVRFLDAIKNLGFRYATKSGISISMGDINITSRREEILERTEALVRRTNTAYEKDPLSMTAQERERSVLNAWIKASNDIHNDVLGSLDKFNPLFLMSQSGATGKIKQMMQIVGMRGLMQDPSGRLIEDLPVKSNFRMGLNLHEYFVSTHGARKGLADTALRTADAGYLTRRLVDVSQDVIIRADDCGTNEGITVREVFESDETHRPDARALLGRHLADPIKHPETGEIAFQVETYISPDIWQQIKDLGLPTTARVRVHMPLETLSERLVGRTSLETVKHPTTKKVLVQMGQEIDRDTAEAIEKAGVREVKIRSILTCKLGRGVCAACYGHDLATNHRVEIGEAVGIIAAQSIGEPGTQLTMRTFHLGGVAQGTSLTGVANVKRARQQALQELRTDISKGTFQMQGTLTEQKREIQRYLKVLEATVGGLLRVVELFEARKPKGEAITTDVDGTVVAIIGGGRAEVQEGINLSLDVETARTGVRKVLIQTTANVGERDKIIGHRLATDVTRKGGKALATANTEVNERILNQIEDAGHTTVTVQREFAVPYRGNLDVRVGQTVMAGDTLTKGPLWPQDVLSWRGVKGVAEYLVQEVQKVYKSQGISIHDKHIEVIVRQMLRKRRIKDPGDTELMPGRLVDAPSLDQINERATAEGNAPATADFVLLGITEAALATESFLSAASFQKTTKVLTEAATHGRVDMLEGLKENVIIGRLIPAGTGLQRKMKIDVELDPAAVEYAQAHADELHAEELRTKPSVKEAINTDEIFSVTGADDVAGMADAGFSVSEGDSELGDEEVEPSDSDLAFEETLDMDGDGIGGLDGMFSAGDE